MPLAVAGLVAGALAPSVVGSWALPVALLVVSLAPCAMLLHRRVGSAWALLGAMALVGCVRASQVAADDLADVDVPRSRYAITGEVRSIRVAPGRGGGTSARLELRVLGASPSDGAVHAGQGVRLAIGRVERAWDLGDRVVFASTVRPVRGFCNGGRDDFARWLAGRGIQWTAWVSDDAVVERLPGPGEGAMPLRLRGRIGRAIDGAAGAEASGVLRALVIGDKGRLSAELRDGFARTGTSHLLAVSGMHLTLVAGAAFFATSAVLSFVPAWASRWPLALGAAPVSWVVAAGYTVLTGGAVSTRRALLMAAFTLLGIGVRRRGSGRTALLLAVLVLVLHDPDVLRDLSFQLSVVSVAALLVSSTWGEGTGIGRLVRPGADASFVRRSSAWVAAGVLASFAAGAATAPLVAHHFAVVSFVGVVANVVVGPLLGVGALGLGLLGAAVSLVAPSVAAWPFRAAGALVELSLGLVKEMAAWPWAAVTFGRPVPWVVASLTLVVTGAFVGRTRLRPIAWSLAASCALAPMLNPAGDSLLRLSLLDVGQGDAVLLESPAGGVWVVDAGGLGGSYDTGEGVVLPALADRSTALRAVVLSHADRDHYGGLPTVVRTAEPPEFWWNGEGSDARSFEELLTELARAGTRVRALDSGSELDGSRDRVDLRVLHPAPGARSLSRNDGSLVLAVRYGATRALLTGDIEARGERLLWRDGGALAATVLKVPHHGSRSSSSRRLVDAVRPALALASLGTFNRFGFPAAEVVDRYRSRGARFRSTGRWGETQLESDGQLERVRSCRR